MISAKKVLEIVSLYSDNSSIFLKTVGFTKKCEVNKFEGNEILFL